MKRTFYRLQVLPFLALFPFITSAESKDKRPNIIVILVDDMGYSDLGCMGSEINTPNLDKLANQGVLFTNFYNTSRCCPSRASLLTGQYQWDAGIGHMDNTRSNAPEYQGYLNNQSITIAEALGSNGYRTFMSGKWHVGNKREHWPDKRGFQQFYGTPEGGGVYFYPSRFYKRDVYKNGKQVHPDSTWYSTDGFTDAALEFIQHEKSQTEPFFMYMAYIAPHFPLQAKPEDIAKYLGQYDKGYDEVRKARFKKQKELGIVRKDLPISAPTYPEWEQVKNKDQEARKMEVYAAMVDNLDQNIGKLIQELKEHQLYENTVIMFLSDNGGCPSNFNKTPNAKIGTRYSNSAYGKWHNVSNTPLRYGKRREHEGGISTPLIVHWPAGRIKHGKIIREPAHINDIMPTCLELSKTTYPDTYKGNKLSKLDGQSFMPLAKGKVQDRKRYYFWEHEGNKAVRQGDWKLVKLHKKPWELYHVKDDPYEMKDLIDQYPDKASELETKYHAWAKDHGVRAWPLH
ncbi:arylsulfatase [Puteibacter caeruleilacunae]|nr:arylsulfatase [Puteibacter caeruleilacunae]